MSLSNYYDRIIQTPLLTKEEESDLFIQIHDAELTEEQRAAAREKVIKANLRFVFKEAKYFSKGETSAFAELISAGNEGLLVALEKYKLDRGYRFLTFAGWWVKQRILSHMASQRLVHLPVARQQLAAKIQKFKEANERVTLDQLKLQFPDKKEKDLEELFHTQFLTFYIEDLTEDSAFEINPIEDEVHAEIDAKKIRIAVAKLPEKIRQAVELSYGMFDGDEWKPSKIAEEMGISVTETKALLEKGLELLKDQF